ncbi:methyltransferase domain-containing protein [Methanomicrobium antiquum]|uniref:Methyltransferase domain-containing protein n=1 Tax=Methanomicrobium antiquum TaxID=487686 RepID=A0AAF0FQI3_9EURY|nr:class I SAM-dependent methyltransferase [Methanomicrobium antiquum]WFN36809.1 methyltransferase domain-containing protein [Methanomicrobium antiquum]
MSGGDEKSPKEKAESMDKIAREIFKEAYPKIADKIINTTKIKSGKCIDAGCGPGMLGISLGKKTSLFIDLLDISEDSGEICTKNLKSENLTDKCRFVLGDVMQMPFEDNYADLVVSRGSIFFWENLGKAFSEILRVLKPGGVAFIGGGFGSAKIEEDIVKKMAKEYPEWRKSEKKGKKTTIKRRLKIVKALLEEEIPYESICDESGFWIILRKKNEIIIEIVREREAGTDFIF